MVRKFELKAPYVPLGDQPAAISKLVEGMLDRLQESDDRLVEFEDTLKLRLTCCVSVTA